MAAARASSSRAARRRVYDAGRAARSSPALFEPRRAGARHLLRHAADRARCSAARSSPADAARVRPRAASSVERARTRSSPGSRPATSCTVWMSHGDRVEQLPPGFERVGDERQLRRSRRSRHADAHDLRRAVPPRGGAHAARRGDPRQLPVRHLPAPSRLDDGAASSTRRSRGSASRSGDGARDLRPVGRRRLVGGGGAGAPRDRRPAAPASSSTTACCAQASAAQVEAMFREHFTGRPARASTPRERFLDELAGVTDPEQKRKIIGREFIEVFEEEAQKRRRRRLPRAGHALPRRDRVGLASSGPSATIKSHHNVGGLPERMKLQADRAAARAVQGRGARARRASSACRAHVLWRQPFPGPGLAVRVLGEVTHGAAATSCARPTRSSRRRSAPPGSTSRSGSPSRVLLPVRTVGVMGDERTYENVLARARGRTRATA